MLAVAERADAIGVDAAIAKATRTSLAWLETSMRGMTILAGLTRPFTWSAETLARSAEIDRVLAGAEQRAAGGWAAAPAPRRERGTGGRTVVVEDGVLARCRREGDRYGYRQRVHELNDAAHRQR